MISDPKNLRTISISGLDTAAEWNTFAARVNAIWNTRAEGPLTLCKGNHWVLDGGADISGGGAWYPANGPMWRIYVYRPLSDNDYDQSNPPSAFYVTGPFTKVSSVNAQRIARFYNSGSGTAVDATFAVNIGFTTDPALYSFQTLSKCPTTGDVLISGGGAAKDLSGSQAFFWSVQHETGEISFNPYSSVLAVLPDIDTTVTGVTSYGETIAMSVGDLSTVDRGIVIFDVDGFIRPAVLPSTYIYNSGVSASYLWLISFGDAYWFCNANLSYPPGLRSVFASLAGGITTNPTWDANAGNGDVPSYAPFPNLASGEDALFVPVNNWNGALLADGAAAVSLGGGGSQGTLLYSEPLVPNNEDLVPFDAMNAAGWRMFGTLTAPTNRLFIRKYSESTYSLTTLDGFNGQVTDAKFFKQAGSGKLQIIVVGEFTTYNGQPAPYMVFIDEDGNRLADLEW